MSKVSKKFGGFAHVRFVSFLFCVKGSEENITGLITNPRLPAGSAVVKTCAFKVICASFRFPRIRDILTKRTRSQIAPTVIQSVMVFMVVKSGFFEVGALGNFSVHEDRVPVWSWRTSHGIPTPLSAAIGSHCSPLPLHDPGVVNGVNGGEFALCERDTVGSVFRHIQFGGSGLFFRRPVCRSSL